MTNPTEAALRFYADPKMWETYQVNHDPPMFECPIGEDGGALARQALAALSTPAPDPVGMDEIEGEPVIVWSRDGERFDTDDLCEHIVSEGLVEGDITERGERFNHDPTEWIHSMDVANTILESLSERSGEECGEFAEDYPPKPTNEALDELDSFLDTWITKHFTPHFWGVKNIAEYEITKEDVDAANGSPPTTTERAGA